MMNIKEQQARQLMCPIMSGNYSLNPNGLSERYNTVNCTASSCMAWDKSKSTNNEPNIGKCGMMK